MRSKARNGRNMGGSLTGDGVGTEEKKERDRLYTHARSPPTSQPWSRLCARGNILDIVNVTRKVAARACQWSINRALVASSSSDAASVDQYYSNLFFQSVETLQKKLCVNVFLENNSKGSSLNNYSRYFWTSFFKFGDGA